MQDSRNNQICSECKGAFNCDFKKGKTHCWCMDYPTTLPLENKHMCLCEDCLKKKIQEEPIVRELKSSDNVWAESLLTKQFGSSMIVSKGRKHDLSDTLGYISEIKKKKVGLLTYNLTEKSCEIISLISLVENKGVGSLLVSCMKAIAKKKNCELLIVVTTNDNLKALRFYQKRGFHIIEFHKNSIIQSRKLKPEIPFIGIDNIPIMDEIELGFLLR